MDSNSIKLGKTGSASQARTKKSINGMGNGNDTGNDTGKGVWIVVGPYHQQSVYHN
jgi:hypothetical protein